MDKKLSVDSNKEEIRIDEGNGQQFTIEVEELIEELENIGDYEGIKEVEKDIEEMGN
ncbi:hypothetical protein [Fundicoccus culcitae]|uniref:Uncharacterized protein n=1 Tax=Fundicoccus culcitae TaxID=2969821 RepID=A0ABY5PAE8_9LACT|nr:hypothetical protein [Fundicoccus culcitae]UUX35430.1 hypothetical protein NRE15_07255 [Fundicoccus culcitae]